jgi:hypothetical protein
VRVVSCKSFDPHIKRKTERGGALFHPKTPVYLFFMIITLVTLFLSARHEPTIGSVAACYVGLIGHDTQTGRGRSGDLTAWQRTWYHSHSGSGLRIRCCHYTSCLRLRRFRPRSVEVGCMRQKRVLQIGPDARDTTIGAMTPHVLDQSRQSLT